jgi:methionyl aminopeptidase
VQQNIKKGEIITLKTYDWINNQKFAGRVVASIHREFFKIVKNKENVKLSDLGNLANSIIRKNNCIPTFLNYKGFKSVICASLNKELVHGTARDIALKEGDVLKIDIGATYNGAIADCAVTYVYGKTSDKIMEMLISCQKALKEAINVVEPGNRIGEIGKVIFQRSKADGFGVITNYGGHGIDVGILHASPFISNKSRADEGITIQPGMSIAIEPMFVLGKNINTKILPDKWTVVTSDIGCHYEHSVTLDKNGNRHIITDHGIEAKDFG